MADSSSVTSHSSWGSRIVGAFTGIIVAIIFIPGSVILLSWNEAHSVKTARNLTAGSKVVIDISADKVDPANEGKLIHVSGDVTTKEGVSDSVFLISAPALSLKRGVEMYQWKETKSSEEKKNLGGSTDTVTTYKYAKEWSGSLIDSSDFNQAQDHKNPDAMVAESRTFAATDAMLGAFKVPQKIVTDMDGAEAIKPTADDFAKLPDSLKPNAHLTSSGYYYGKDPAVATVGDQRITFETVAPGTFSILAQQSGNTFQTYMQGGTEILRVESGTESASAMFEHAKSENAMLTWILRIVGFIFMAAGFAMLFQPLSVIADVVPFIGNIIGAGTGIAAFLLALAGTFLTIAIAWVAVRPLFGISLLVVAVAVVIGVHRLGARRPKKAS